MTQPTDPTPPLAWRFDAFELRLRSRELLREGRPVELQGKVFDLIAHLVAHADRVVDKNELLDAVWPRQVVTEAALSRAVMKARRALGDDAAEPRILMTMHGRGFRIIAAVQPSSPMPSIPFETVPTAPHWPSSAHSTTRRPAAWTLLVSLALLSALVAGALMLAGEHAPSTDEADVRLLVLPVRNDTGEPTLDWIELGLMGAMTQALQESGYLQASSGARVSAAPGVAAEDLRALHARLHAEGRASHVLATRIERPAGTLRFHAELHGVGAHERRRMFVGSDPLALAREVVHDTVAAIGLARGLHRGQTTQPQDPLAQEAYVRGLSLTYQGRNAEALPFLELAVAADPDAFWPALEHAVTLRNLDRTEEAEARLQALVARTVDSGDLAHEKAARTSLGNLQRRQGRLDAARANIERAVEISRQLAQHAALVIHLNALAQVSMLQHRYDAAAALIDEADAVVSAQLGGRPDYGLLETRGIIALHALALDEAEAALRAAHALAERQGNLTQQGWSRYYLAEAAWHDARIDDAADHAAAAADAFARGGLRSGHLRALRLQAITGAQRGDFAAAEATVAALRDADADTGRIAEAEAWIAYERGDADATARWQALADASGALSHEAVHEAGHEPARRRLLALRALLAGGDRAGALQLIEADAEPLPDDAALERALHALARALARGEPVPSLPALPALWRGYAWDLRAWAALASGEPLPAPGEREPAGYRPLAALVEATRGVDADRHAALQTRLAALHPHR